MNLTHMVLSALQPIGVACIATLLALTCKYHPRTRAVIIPDAEPEDERSTHPPDPLTSDLDTRHKLLVTIGVALGLVLTASLVLWALARTDLLATLTSTNVLVVAIIGLVVMFQLPALAMSLTWMTPWRGALTGVACAGVIVTWVLVDSWITVNLVAALMCVVLALQWQSRISFLRLTLFLLIFAVLYDALQVYGTGNMESLADAATPVVGAPERKLTMPMLFLIPGELSLTPQRYGMLGVGDVFVLCLMAIAAARLGKKLGSWVPVGVTFVGFAAAMMVSGVVMRHFSSAQLSRQLSTSCRSVRCRSCCTPSGAVALISSAFHFTVGVTGLCVAESRWL